MKEPFGLHSVAEPLPHPEQAAVGAVHAEDAGDALAGRRRLAVRKGAGAVTILHIAQYGLKSRTKLLVRSIYVHRCTCA